MNVVLAAVLGLSSLLALFAWSAQRRLLRAPPADAPDLPPVSVLKPLKGSDAGLESNLRCFLDQDHPDYEVIFAVQDPEDPAVAVVERLLASGSRAPARLVIASTSVGLNPKVDNVAHAAAVALHEVLLISDSNVRVGRGYVRELAARLAAPGVGLVSSVIKGVSAGGMGADLESLQLDTFVMGSVCAVASTGRPCVVGKSMMVRKGDIERIGGWELLGRHLAEDQVCGEEIHRLGLRVELSGQPVDNMLGRLSLHEVVRRHLRWARMRRHLDLRGYALEALANPVGIGLLGAALVRTPAALALAAAAIALSTALGASSEALLGVRRPLPRRVALEVLRGAGALVLWPVPLFSSSVRWRGQELRIGRRTLLVPVTTMRGPPRL